MNFYLRQMFFFIKIVVVTVGQSIKENFFKKRFYDFIENYSFKKLIILSKNSINSVPSVSNLLPETFVKIRALFLVKKIITEIKKKTSL